MRNVKNEVDRVHEKREASPFFRGRGQPTDCLLASVKVVDLGDCWDRIHTTYSSPSH